MAGSLVSSAMFTESSNPTIAKNASDVAAVTATKAFFSVAVSNATTREKSTSPPRVNAHNPTRITSSRPVISMMVSTTLSLTLSPDATQIHHRKQRHEEQCQARRFRQCPN